VNANDFEHFKQRQPGTEEEPWQLPHTLYYGALAGKKSSRLRISTAEARNSEGQQELNPIAKGLFQPMQRVTQHRVPQK